MDNFRLDLFWKNISSLPYFRGFLRAVEGRFYQDIEMKAPILDLGIGDGHFTSITFSEDIKVGLDPWFTELREAKKTHGCENHVCSFGDHIPLKSGYFSTVYSNSVLEHIESLDPVLSEVNRILVRNGKFIITVPNDNFTKNLSVGKWLNSLGMKRLALSYQRFFNRISRHRHPDSVLDWEHRIRAAGFKIIKSWNYFPPTSLQILEWGHLFGIPSWISKKIISKWILFPYKWNLWIITFWLEKQYKLDQRSNDGAYTFFILEK